MPYQWLPSSGGKTQLHLWPHRSLPRRGMVWFVASTAALLGLPLLVLLGSPVVWGLLPFVMLTVMGIWLALQRSYKDGEIVEQLTILPHHMALVRLGPRGARAEWAANPYWVLPMLHAAGGPVPNYVTLRGGPREVELGAFLSEPERLALFGEMSAMLRQMKEAPPPATGSDRTGTLQTGMG